MTARPATFFTEGFGSRLFFRLRPHLLLPRQALAKGRAKFLSRDLPVSVAIEAVKHPLELFLGHLLHQRATLEFLPAHRAVAITIQFLRIHPGRTPPRRTHPSPTSLEVLVLPVEEAILVPIQVIEHLVETFFIDLFKRRIGEKLRPADASVAIGIRLFQKGIVPAPAPTFELVRRDEAVAVLVQTIKDLLAVRFAESRRPLPPGKFLGRHPIVPIAVVVFHKSAQTRPGRIFPVAPVLSRTSRLLSRREEDGKHRVGDNENRFHGCFKGSPNKTTGKPLCCIKSISFAWTLDRGNLAFPSMAILSSLRDRRTTLSFEFFPPKTDQAGEELLKIVHELDELNPAFVSVTYGAGGTTRDRTRDLVRRIIRETAAPTIPHLTCIGHSREEMTEILDQYAEDKVGTILALRGDPPRNDPSYDRSKDDFCFAKDLVTFIKDHPHPFEIGVAGFPEGHPATQNRLKEMDYFKEKVDAGADYICTQLFFDNHDFFDYRDRCDLAGIDLPIVAGIMPITTLQGMNRMAELAAGSRFPAKLLATLAKAGDDPESIRQAGLDYAIAQCQELIEGGLSGLHLYTLNKSRATREIAAALTF